jgi:hypothetical protein
MSENSGLPIYCESSPTTFTMYQKFGFKILKEKLIHSKEVLGTEEDIEVPLMVRMPAAAGQLSFEDWQDLGYPSWDKVPITNSVVEENPAAEPVVVEEAAPVKESVAAEGAPASVDTSSKPPVVVAATPIDTTVVQEAITA